MDFSRFWKCYRKLITSSVGIKIIVWGLNSRWQTFSWSYNRTNCKQAHQFGDENGRPMEVIFWLRFERYCWALIMLIIQQWETVHRCLVSGWDCVAESAPCDGSVRHHWLQCKLLCAKKLTWILHYGHYSFVVDMG